MRILYNILTHIAGFHLKIIAFFHAKIRLGVNGRRKTFSDIETHFNKDEKVLWFHCASLGEYEQGLPVFEAVKKEYPEHKILLSFFSPSGYEIKKNAPIADLVVYLPLDTQSNAKRFVDLIQPELTIFVKYEIWPNYLFELKKKGHKTLLISALFRKDQMYFKSIGSWIKRSLNAFEHIFVQNESSKSLLNSHGFQNVSISGDTRFDRVFDQLEMDNELPFVEQFKGDHLCVVAGSTWPEGEQLLVKYINEHDYDCKFIIAPHNIKPQQIAQLKNAISKPTVLYSEKDKMDLKQYDVLILDTIGLLSRVYYYASIAYIGGAVGTTGLHNTLEAAVFDNPIIIGTNYNRFPEAHDMIAGGGMFAISNQDQLNSILTELIKNDEKRLATGQFNYEYILKNKGAVIQIMDYIRK